MRIPSKLFVRSWCINTGSRIFHLSKIGIYRTTQILHSKKEKKWNFWRRSNISIIKVLKDEMKRKLLIYFSSIDKFKRSEIIYYCNYKSNWSDDINSLERNIVWRDKIISNIYVIFVYEFSYSVWYSTTTSMNSLLKHVRLIYFDFYFPVKKKNTRTTPSNWIMWWVNLPILFIFS